MAIPRMIVLQSTIKCFISALDSFQIDSFDLNRHVRFAEGECSHGTQIVERPVSGFGDLLAGSRNRRRQSGIVPPLTAC
ncbi:MAG: hypothetical protein PHE79_09525 [Eubacteriales bacterium]|nr:hypothetical protein [Eubacteriales bacterium]